MTALMEDTGLAQVFAVLRAHAQVLPDSERYAYMASLAVEEACMAEALSSKDAVELWSTARPRARQVVEDGAPPVKVWDLTPQRPRFAPRHAVAVIPGPRSHSDAPVGSSL